LLRQPCVLLIGLALSVVREAAHVGGQAQPLLRQPCVLLIGLALSVVREAAHVGGQAQPLLKHALRVLRRPCVM